MAPPESAPRRDDGGAPIVAVIPALDAAASIVPVVEGALRHAARVLVVDDGSSDDTGARARAAGAETIRHPVNLGKGAALGTAFRHLLATARPFAAVVTLDADGQHDPSDIPAFVALHAQRRPALIVGSRDRDVARRWGPRRAMNRFSSAAMRVFAGVDLPDTQSGFRLYDAGFLERLRLEGTRYEAEMEALLRAAEWGLPIASVPIHLRVVDGRETSHYRALPDTFRIIGMVLRHRLRRGRT